ncbi:tyrosine-type recombinase/integrase [Carnimonas bestiolae]|uniref:tyrosine-type recombinase/integrase n=1 Tax=Carnimonas bestiolae TaxID=3402172 RepID=UPI003EDBD1BB
MDIVYKNFDDLLDRYFLERVLRPATKTSYRSAVKALCRYNFNKNILPKDITRDHVLLWRQSALFSPENPNGISPASWNNYVRHLSSLFAFAIEEKIFNFEKNPFRKVKVAEPRKLKKVFTYSEIEKLRLALPTNDYKGQNSSSFEPSWFWRAVFEVFYQSGIRQSQLLRMKLQDINLEARIIVLSAEASKTNSEAILPIPNPLLPHLSRLILRASERHFNSSDQLFNVNRFSNRYNKSVMDVDQVQAFYRRLTLKTGIKANPHKFRHSLATDLMNRADRNVHLAREILNHSNIRTTLGYIHPDIEEIRKVLDLREMDAKKNSRTKSTEN